MGAVDPTPVLAGAAGASGSGYTQTHTSQQGHVEKLRPLSKDCAHIHLPELLPTGTSFKG